jgi:NADH-quinone oxidoreductase subunit G
VAGALKGLKGEQIGAIIGDTMDVEAMFALKGLMGALGSGNVDCRQDGAKIGYGPRASWLFNATIAGIEQADAILIVGSNPRVEAPILNARIRKRWLQGRKPVKIGVIGPQAALTYPYEYLGAGPDSLQAVLDGKSPFLDVLKAAERPMLILGMGALARADGAAVLAAGRALAEATGMVSEDWNGFSVLHTAAARVGGLDLGLVPGEGGRDVAGILAGAEDGAIKAVWLLGADEIDTARLKNAFVIYQGHHGDRGAHGADVILPGAAYTEKPGIYVNTEGRVQMARRAAFPPGEAREDWKILRAASEALGATLPYDDLASLRRALYEALPHFQRVDAVEASEWGAFGETGPMQGAAFATPVANFYMTDPISRASETMAACTKEFVLKSGGATGTDG